MKVNEIMTAEVQVIRPETNLQEAAQFMRSLGVGALPVCDGNKIVGMLTDRDIVVRGVADGMDLTATTAADCMTEKISYCFDDEDLEQAQLQMQEKQLRRLPVVNRDKKLVGIISIGDLAIKVDEPTKLGRTIQEISEPEAEDFDR